MKAFDRHLCASYIAEYLTYRKKKKWNSTIQVALSWFSGFLTKRQKECEDLIKKINTASTYATMVEIIDLTGEAARKAQKAKKEKEDYKLYPQYLNYFLEDNSLWAKALHAVRTRWVSVILASEFREQFIEENKALIKEVNRYNNEILEANLEISIADLKEKRSIPLNKLLDRQVGPVIQFARCFNLFPTLLPSFESPKFPGKITIYTDVPVVYLDKYFNVYFLNEIVANPARHVEFTKELKERLALELPQTRLVKEFDIMDDIEVLQTIHSNSTNNEVNSQPSSPQILLESSLIPTIENYEGSLPPPSSAPQPSTYAATPLILLAQKQESSQNSLTNENNTQQQPPRP